MGRLSFQHSIKYAFRRRPRELISVVPVIALYDKNYRNASQAATTIAWLIVSNIVSRNPDQKNIPQDKIDDLYVKARRRVLPICHRLLSQSFQQSFQQSVRE
jgi:hypothetical protein